MEIETESKSGSWDSDVEVAGCEKRMNGTDYDRDGRLKLEMVWNPVKMQIQSLLADMDRLMTSGKGEEEGRIVQSDAKLLLEKEGMQMLKGSLNLLSEKINQRLVDHEELDGIKDASKMDSAMGNSLDSAMGNGLDSAVGNSKEGHATKVDSAVGNSEEDHATKVDSTMGNGVDSAVGNSEEGHATKVDSAVGNSEEGHATKVDSAVENSEEGHATKVDSAMGNTKEDQGTKVSLVMRNSKEGLKGDKPRKRKVSKKELKFQKQVEKYEEYRRKMNEEELHRDPDELTDPYAYQARLFEKRWNEVYLNLYGRLEDNTSLPCKRYTVDPAPYGGHKCDTLQVFSVKVAQLRGGLQWPLDVFGMVALRDILDHKRNVIFKRERGNCQTLTDENPYLVLTGPVRGVVFDGPVVFEVRLYVRGITESDDKELSLLAVRLIKFSNDPLESLLVKKSYTSRLSTLDFEHGHIVYSVEATISVKVISGPPDGFYGEFAASTDILKCEVLLHSSGFEERHLAGDEINLSRSVISVETFGKLIVSVRVSDGSVTLTGTKKFRPLEKGITTGRLRIAKLCQLEFTVAWSLFS